MGFNKWTKNYSKKDEIECSSEVLLQCYIQSFFFYEIQQYKISLFMYVCEIIFLIVKIVMVPDITPLPNRGAQFFFLFFGLLLYQRELIHMPAVFTWSFFSKN
jgi:hypothetical protein